MIAPSLNKFRHDLVLAGLMLVFSGAAVRASELAQFLPKVNPA